MLILEVFSLNMDVERVLEEIGSFGIWQIWIYFWIFYIVCFSAAVNVVIIFMQYIPEFICRNPLTKLSNWTFEEIQIIRLGRQKGPCGVCTCLPFRAKIIRANL